MKHPMDDLHASGLTEIQRERTAAESGRRSLEYYLLHLREKGLLYGIQSLSWKLWHFLFYRRWILDSLFCPLYRAFHRPRHFVFRQRKYPYFCHSYNTTWKVERAIEIPIVWEFVKSSKEGRVLEVGNVLSRYYPVTHDILDKYEHRQGVINEDLVDFSPASPYDLIVSISTIEHIGWDEKVRDPQKLLAAVERLREIRNPGAFLLATVPLGYNSFLDERLISQALPFSEIFFMKRISKPNEWKETAPENCRGISYGRPFPGANAIAVILDRKE